MTTLRIVAFCCLAFTMLVLVACGTAQEGTDTAVREADWAWLEENHQLLDAKRSELKQLRAVSLEEPEKEAEAPEEGAADAEVPLTPEEREAGIAELEKELELLNQEFVGRLVDFINAEPLLQGEEPTELQLAAIRMKSHEDMLVAREFIEKGGDYRRAIEIYQTALMADPNNEELQAAIDEAEELRYMTEERFSQVRKGMTEDEVREVLGPVYLQNIKEYPDKGITAWYYRKEDGGAAGVFFEVKRGVKKVYQSDFEAIKPQVIEAGDEEF